MSDNPFSEPDDSDRTIVRLPGGPPLTGRPAVTVPESQPVPASDSPFGEFTTIPGAGNATRPGPATPPNAPIQPDTRVGEPVTVPRVGRSPLLLAAAPLIDLLTVLGSGDTLRVQGSAEHLRDRAQQALQVFEAEGRAAQIPEEVLRAAHYALCATLDDLALASAWSQGSGWAGRSLTSALHRDTKGGEGFFDQLVKMEQDPGRYLPALELSYYCLALGMRGRYRLSTRSRDELDSIREGLYQLLVRLSPPVERDLSARWRGVDAPHLPPGRDIPLWVPPAVALAVLALAWVIASAWINGQGDALGQSLAALPPATAVTIRREGPVVAPAAVPADNSALAALARLLQPEVDQHRVTLEGDQQHILIRLAGNEIFDSGSAELHPSYNGLLQRIAQALHDLPGSIRVLGHTDNQPIRTVAFPSNFALSAARAASARAVMVQAMPDIANRSVAEGRADTEPLAGNDTAEGRAQNRRTEIILLRGEGR